METNLASNSVGARYFVVEPGLVGVTEITAHLGWESWHCVKLMVTAVGKVHVAIYTPGHQGISHTIPRKNCEGFGLANAVADMCKAAALPRQVKYALSHEGVREEYYFWKPNASAETWDASQYTPVHEWEEFVWDKTCTDNQTEYGKGSPDTHFRLDIVLPRPWQKELKRSMLLWTPGSKTPRRYNISNTTTRDEIVAKLEKSGFNIPEAIKEHIKWWDISRLRLWW
jgi:hypothetical protein